MRKDIYIKKTTLYFIFLYAMGMTVTLVSRRILPDKFFYDSITIKNIIYQLDDRPFSYFNSYANTARFYKFLGFEFIDSVYIEGIINYTLVFIPLFIVYKLLSISFTKFTLFNLMVWNTLLAIFAGQLSKEVIATAFVLFQVIATHKQTKGYKTLVILSVIFYALFFRKYWFIVLFFSVIIFISTTKNFKIFGVTFLANKVYFSRYFIRFNVLIKAGFAFIGLFLVLASAKLNNMYLTDVRSMVNVGREGSPDATTIINNLLPNSSVLTDALNWISSWIRLLIPIEILPHGGIQHISFIFWNSFCILYFIVMVRFFMRNADNSHAVHWSIAWIISFSFVQGVFEPDFGSFVRHEIVLLPMFLYLMLYYRKARIDRRKGMVLHASNHQESLSQE